MTFLLICLYANLIVIPESILIRIFLMPDLCIQVVCRILCNVSPLPPAQSSDYLILKNNGSEAQVQINLGI